MKYRLYWRSATTELREVMWEEMPLCINFSKLDYVGPCSSKMQRHMLDHAMSVKEWVSRNDEMNYYFNPFELYKNLRSGRLNSLGRSTLHLNIQSLGTLLPQKNTLHIRLRQKLFRTARPILLLGSFFRILSLNLDVLGV